MSAFSRSGVQSAGLRAGIISASSHHIRALAPALPSRRRAAGQNRGMATAAGAVAPAAGRQQQVRELHSRTGSLLLVLVPERCCDRGASHTRAHSCALSAVQQGGGRRVRVRCEVSGEVDK